MTAIPARTHPRGFTLLEVMMALLLMAVIIGMVMGIARTSLNLSKTIVEHQNVETERHAFVDLLTERFASLPGNARFDLKSTDGGGQEISDLTLQNVPMSFTWDGQERTAKAVRLSTVKRRSGFLDIVLRYYENEILTDATGATGRTSPTEEEAFAEIGLLRDVAYFEWRALNATTMEWQSQWDDSGSVPIQLELVFAQGVNGKETRHVFWLPPKLDPAQAIRLMTTKSPQQGGNSPHVEIQVPGSLPKGGKP